MLPPRKASTAEQLRRLAVSMVLDGEQPADVADLLDVSERSVWRWFSRWRKRGRLGDAALAHRRGPGRPTKLSGRQARDVLFWIKHGSPCDFGFINERWTAPRVAAVIEDRLGIVMNPRYLNRWLWWRGITPQIPPRVPRERDDGVIAAWLHHAWPGIKKKPPTAMQPLDLPMKADFFCSPWCAALLHREAKQRPCDTVPVIAIRCRSRPP